MSVGVVGGDMACIRSVVRQWTGKIASRMIPPRVQVLRLADMETRRDLVFLLSPAAIDPWPGGPLIWLLPERGPSEPELAQLRLTLNINRTDYPAVSILLCLPAEVDTTAASSDLDIITETLHWAVDSPVEINIEAVWLSGNGPCSIAHWLSRLG